MGTFWDKERIEMYEAACQLLNYPEVPLKAYFDEIIRPTDTVLEIGSGVGVVTLYLAKICEKVIAVDEDLEGCNHLKKRAKENRMTNIEILHSEWPQQQVNVSGDVSITLYVNKAFNTENKLKELLQATKRTGLIMIPHESSCGEYPDFVYQELGIDLEQETRFDSGQRTIEQLEKEGVKVRYSTIYHEFGQPVQNLDEGARFFMRMLKVKKDTYFPKAREIVEKIVETREGQWYVPYLRKNWVIIFEK